MIDKDVLIQVRVVGDQQGRHVQKALQTFADNFKPDEMIRLSKMIENPLVKKGILVKLALQK